MLVLRGLLRVGREVLHHRLRRVVGRRAALPVYQIVGPAAGSEGFVVEKLLHHLQPRRLRSGVWVGRSVPGRARAAGLESRMLL